jgi:hypothetical protein
MRSEKALIGVFFSCVVTGDVFINLIFPDLKDTGLSTLCIQLPCLAGNRWPLGLLLLIVEDFGVLKNRGFCLLTCSAAFMMNERVRAASITCSHVLGGCHLLASPHAAKRSTRTPPYQQDNEMAYRSNVFECRLAHKEQNKTPRHMLSYLTTMCAGRYIVLQVCRIHMENVPTGARVILLS